MEEARQKGRGKGKGKGAGDAPRAGKGKGKSQPRAGKGSGQEQASAIRLDPILEAAYQEYLSRRRADQPRVSRAAWLRNNVRSDSTVRAAVRNRMEAVRGGPIAGPPAAPAPKGESASATPRQPPPPPKPRPRVLRVSGTCRPPRPPALPPLPRQRHSQPSTVARQAPLTRRRNTVRQHRGRVEQRARQQAQSMRSMLNTGASCGACKPGQPGVRHLTGVGA